MSSQEEMQAKQNYLREYIPQNQYEDFLEYCQNFAGNLQEEFETWTMQQLKVIVSKYFLHQQEKINNAAKKETSSFYVYQTGNEKQLKEIREQLRKQQQNSQPNLNVPQSTTLAHKASSPVITNHKVPSPSNNKNTPPTQNKAPQQQSAMEFLDSIFDKNDKNSIVPQKEEFQSKKYDKSFFESNKFWEVPSVGEPVTNSNKKQIENHSSVKTEVKFATNTQPIQNFQVMFTSGLTVPVNSQSLSHTPKDQTKAFKKQPESKKAREWDMDAVGVQDRPAKSEETKKAREWNMVEIQVDDPPPMSSSQVTLPKESSQIKKSNITLKSIKNISTPRKKIPYQGQSLLKQPLVTSVACFKSLERINLSHSDLKITIKDHSIIERSFFSSNYPMFHLKVMPATITCKRNFEDFMKLKRNLEGSYPGLRLPYLDKQGIFQSQTSEQYIERQKRYLQFFMEDILTHPQLRNSRILEYFLTLKDHKAMKRKFEEYDEKIKKVSALEELCLLDGEVPIELTETNRQYCELLPRLLDRINAFWDNQERMLLHINSLYVQLVQNYKNWSEAIESIRKDVIQFNQKVSTSELHSLETTFDELQRYANQCKNFNQNQQRIIKQDVLPILRYEKLNMNQLNQLIDTQSQLIKAYLSRRGQENSQDNLEYLSERLKDYKDGVLTESSHITVLKYQCGYINYLLPKEAERYFDRLSKKTSVMVSDICFGKLKNLSKSTNVYTQLVIS